MQSRVASSKKMPSGIVGNKKEKAKFWKLFNGIIQKLLKAEHYTLSLTELGITEKKDRPVLKTILKRTKSQPSLLTLTKAEDGKSLIVVLEEKLVSYINSLPISKDSNEIMFDIQEIEKKFFEELIGEYERLLHFQSLTQPDLTESPVPSPEKANAENDISVTPVKGLMRPDVLFYVMQKATQDALSSGNSFPILSSNYLADKLKEFYGNVSTLPAPHILMKEMSRASDHFLIAPFIKKQTNTSMRNEFSLGKMLFKDGKTLNKEKVAAIQYALNQFHPFMHHPDPIKILHEYLIFLYTRDCTNSDACLPITSNQENTIAYTQNNNEINSTSITQITQSTPPIAWEAAISSSSTLGTDNINSASPLAIDESNYYNFMLLLHDGGLHQQGQEILQDIPDQAQNLPIADFEHSNPPIAALSCSSTPVSNNTNYLPAPNQQKQTQPAPASSPSSTIASPSPSISFFLDDPRLSPPQALGSLSSSPLIQGSLFNSKNGTVQQTRKRKPADLRRKDKSPSDAKRQKTPGETSTVAFTEPLTVTSTSTNVQQREFENLLRQNKIKEVYEYIFNNLSKDNKSGELLLEIIIPYHHELAKNKDNRLYLYYLDQIVKRLIANNQFESDYRYKESHLSIILTTYGFKDALKLLIEKGGKINIADNDGNTPLHLAAAANNVDCVKVLCDATVDRSALNSKSETALAYALRTLDGKKQKLSPEISQKLSPYNYNNYRFGK